MTSDADRLTNSLRILLRAFTIDERRFPAAEGKMRYKGPDFQTIHFIGVNPDCNALSLSNFLGVTATTTQSVLDRLVRKGLVARSKSKVDARAVALRLTPEGEEVRDTIARQDRANCKQMLAVLDPAQRAQLLTALDTIASAVEGVAK